MRYTFYRNVTEYKIVFKATFFSNKFEYSHKLENTFSSTCETRWPSFLHCSTSRNTGALFLLQCRVSSVEKQSCLWWNGVYLNQTIQWNERKTVKWRTKKFSRSEPLFSSTIKRQWFMLLKGDLLICVSWMFSGSLWFYDHIQTLRHDSLWSNQIFIKLP